MLDYVHQEIDEEIRSIGGYYLVVEEGVFPYDGRDVLYIVKLAKVESCCGTGGCGYILVPGYAISWKYRQNDSGLAVSEVEPIQDEKAQSEIRDLLMGKYPYYSRVDFG